jgi:hypothetical protein
VNVEIVRIDQGAVDVEENCRCGCHPS